MAESPQPANRLPLLQDEAFLVREPGSGTRIAAFKRTQRYARQAPFIRIIRRKYLQLVDFDVG